jgi:hypothetical protein
MNNTITKRNLTLAAVFMAAILVVGTIAVTTTTQSSTAFAYMMKKPVHNDKKDKTRDGGGNNNGNTITIQKCKQAAIQSGWDNDQSQECENLICTHPGENATCVQEAAAVVTPTPIPTPVKKTCEECFTSLLTQAQINSVISQINSAGIGLDIDSLAELCADLEQGKISESVFIRVLGIAGISETVAIDLIQCLINAGVPFEPIRVT